MLDPKFIQEHIEEIRTNMTQRGRNPDVIGLDALPTLFEEKKKHNVHLKQNDLNKKRIKNKTNPRRN